MQCFTNTKSLLLLHQTLLLLHLCCIARLLKVLLIITDTMAHEIHNNDRTAYWIEDGRIGDLSVGNVVIQ